MALHIVTGSGAPATTPTAVGQHYIDTVGGVSYISVGTTSSADWETSDASAAIAAHVAAGDPHTQYAETANNLSDLANAGTARTNLGLGTAATQASSAFDAAGAATSAQAFAIQRSNHTGTQLAATISDFAAAADAAVLPTGGTTGQVLAKASGTDFDVVWNAAGSGSGDVVGPASSTDNAITRFDGTTGKLVQNSAAKVEDSGVIIAGDGSAATPAYGFASEPGNDTGMYWVGAGQIGWTSQGVHAMQLDAGGDLTIVGNITAANYPPTGSTDTFAGYDGSGNLNPIPGWAVSSLSGMQVGLQYAPAGGSGGVLAHNLALNVEPTANSPDRASNALYINMNFDTASSGFTYGTNGNAGRLLDLGFGHSGTGDIGEINFIQNYFSVGNGTDPISVRGISYSYGFGSVNANVTIDGPIQGYGFQPSVNASATIDSSVNITAFYDASTFATGVNSYISYNASPTLTSVANNSNYTGLNMNPNITTFTGNAGANMLAVSGQFGTLNSGSINCLNASPNVTLNKGYVSGVNVNMTSVTNYAGVQSSIVVQDITYTFTLAGNNNAYTIEYVDDVVAGSESFVIAGNDVTVHIESGVSTATQVAAASAANLGFAGAVTTTITGTASNAQVTFAQTNFAGGIDPGRTEAANFRGDVVIDGGLSFSGGLSIGALNAFGTSTMVSGSGNPTSIHTLITAPTVAANATLTLADTLGVNTAMLLTVGANASVTTGFLGLQALGLPAVVSMDTGSTIDHVGGAVFAISLDGAAAGGTIAEVDLCSALAIPNGVTTITELRGYFFDLPFGDVGTTIWGLYAKPASAINYMAGSCVVGTSDTPSNASVGIELNATDKAVLTSRMTTTQKNALTAVAGMVVFDTTLNQLSYYDGSAWVNI